MTPWYDVYVEEGFPAASGLTGRKLDSLSLEQSIQECSKIIDASLRALYVPGLTAGDLRQLYFTFGTKSYPLGPEFAAFSTFDYVTQKCSEVCLPPADPSAFQRVIDAQIRLAEEPLVATILNPESRGADDVHATIHVINTTNRSFLVSTKAEFFQTADEETGEGILTGPHPAEGLKLEPSSSRMIGDIIEWELDSALGLSVSLIQPEGRRLARYYDLKSGASVRCILPVMNVAGILHRGRVVKT